MRILLGICCFVVWIGQCQSQLRLPLVDITKADTVGYGFLNEASNTLQRAEHLDPVFRKMHEQRTRGGQKINIVHIGDSHILGNFLTRAVRERLQREFGDAGRGLVFPYKLADSNGPKDYVVSAEGRWSGSNCQRDLNATTPYGISGFSIHAAGQQSEITVKLIDTASSETKMFTKVTVFQHRSDKDYDLEVMDEVSGQSAMLFLEGDYSRSYYFDRPVGQAKLAARRTSAAQKQLHIDGISLENELSGVIYHSIGVNGAKFSDYSRARYFAKQVADLNPDIIVLSFGTNEAQANPDPSYLYKTIKDLADGLEQACPGARFVITTPADSYLRGKGFNPYLPEVSSIIRRFAGDKGYALWDLFALGGGENSAASWKGAGLMSHDSVHYSKVGYMTQGKLFYQSLIQGYNDFVSAKR
jgi:hypothetical protein